MPHSYVHKIKSFFEKINVKTLKTTATRAPFFALMKITDSSIPSELSYLPGSGISGLNKVLLVWVLNNKIADDKADAQGYSTDFWKLLALQRFDEKSRFFQRFFGYMKRAVIWSRTISYRFVVGNGLFRNIGGKCFCRCVELIWLAERDVRVIGETESTDVMRNLCKRFKFFLGI